MRIGFYVQVFESLGVEYLSACLKQAGHETFVFFDPKLGNDTFMNNSRLARLLDIEDILVEKMLEADLDLVAFSVMTDTYANSLRIAQKLKNSANIKTVFGGIHVSCVPEKVVRETAVDYLIVGEGEQALVELANALQAGDDPNGIPNLGYCGNGEAVLNPLRPLVENLDTLPFPDSELFWKRAGGYRNSCYNIVASRGCPLSCTFCCNPLMKKMYKGKGKWHRRRSVDNVIEELKLAREMCSFNRVQFWDDDFVDDISWLAEFSKKYAETIRLPFFAWAHPKNIDEEAALLLAKAGCQELSLGVQSVYPSTRKEYLRRFETDEQIRQAFDALRKTNIFISTQNILQLPGQTVEEAHALAEFYFENPVNLAHVQLLRYYPRTEVVEIARKQGLLTCEQIELFEDAKNARLLSVAQADDQPEFLKVRNFVVLMSVLPRFVSKFLLHKKRYRHLPVTRTSHIVIILCGLIKRVFSKKRRFTMVYTVPEYCTHYLYFIWRKLCWKLGKR